MTELKAQTHESSCCDTAQLYSLKLEINISLTDTSIYVKSIIHVMSRNYEKPNQLGPLTSRLQLYVTHLKTLLSARI